MDVVECPKIGRNDLSEAIGNPLLALTADIVAAHVANNEVAVGDLPELIKSVHDALDEVGKPARTSTSDPKPFVSIRSSIKPDYIICLEDGAKLKMLKRYLRTHYDMSPEQYRAKWNLPHDYPMVAYNYAERRR